MLRQAVNADRTISNQLIREEAGTETLEEMVKNRTGNLIEKFMEHNTPLIRNLLDSEPTGKTDNYLRAINRHYQKGNEQ